jgi:Mor family transcriptional regulator
MPDDVYKLRCKSKHIKVNEDALVADYQDGMRLKDIGRRYHICDSRVYNILRKRGMVL